LGGKKTNKQRWGVEGDPGKWKAKIPKKRRKSCGKKKGKTDIPPDVTVLTIKHLKKKGDPPWIRFY